MTGFRHLGDQLIHRGYIWNLVTAEFEAPGGTVFHRNIVRSPGAVAVVPLLISSSGAPTVVLVSQYRPPYDRIVIEIPAGMRDVPGEPPEETGRRELIEEAGLSAGLMSHLVDTYPSPGMTDSICSVFLATDCTPVERDLHGPEEQHMGLLHVSLAEALAMIDDGEISDSKTIAGLLMTDRRLRADVGT